MTSTLNTKTQPSPSSKSIRLRRNRSESQWRKLLEQFNVSGLTQAQFCKDHHISSGSFHKWKKRLFASDKGSLPNRFIEVAPLEQNAITVSEPTHRKIKQNWDVELELAKGCILRVRLS